LQRSCPGTFAAAVEVLGQAMETDVVCPDCGKYIAPEGAVENHLRCRCGEARGPKVTAKEVSVRPSIKTKIAIPETPAAEPEKESEPTGDTTVSMSAKKSCYICGADLTGRVRLKDHLGRYWCKDCSAADARAKRREDELRCPDCSRVFPEHKLVYFQTTRVCTSCFKDREKELEKKIKKAAAEKLHTRAEWQGIKWMAIIAGVLLLLGTMGYLFSR
jgi:hypothetical protein